MTWRMWRYCHGTFAILAIVVVAAVYCCGIQSACSKTTANVSEPIKTKWGGNNKAITNGNSSGGKARKTAQNADSVYTRAYTICKFSCTYSSVCVYVCVFLVIFQRLWQQFRCLPFFPSSSSSSSTAQCLYHFVVPQFFRRNRYIYLFSFSLPRTLHISTAGKQQQKSTLNVSTIVFL